MIRAIDELRRWLGKCDIPTDSLTLIVNFSDASAALRFDTAMTEQLWHLNRELELRPDFVGGVKMYGIKVKLESPAHEPSA